MKFERVPSQKGVKRQWQVHEISAGSHYRYEVPSRFLISIVPRSRSLESM
jgi:hypothetical protein